MSAFPASSFPMPRQDSTESEWTGPGLGDQEAIVPGTDFYKRRGLSLSVSIGAAVLFIVIIAIIVVVAVLHAKS